ncbi:MAG TPA: M23 family metallopeptidase [Candidatus Babeliales bacterium]|nr:M23 family metallopeptidase [Candidatus Babeliales bacterium]
MFTIKNIKLNSVKLLWLGLVCILGVSCFIFWRDYRTLKESTEELYALQEEYRSYLTTLKQIIDELAPNTEQEESTENDSADEKKKSLNSSSEFEIVDRRPTYLKQSLLNYIQEKDLNIDMNEIDRIYKSYTDHTAEHLSSLHKRKLRSSGRRRPVRKPIMRRRPYARDIVFSWPLDRERFWISSFFGRRKRSDGSWGFHRGIDLAALRGTPIKAVASGKVIEAGFVKGYGNTILIMHNDKYKTRYAHLQKLRVKPGQIVRRGQFIGTVGATGYVRKSGRDASHLHFEVHRLGKQINPLYYLA